MLNYSYKVENILKSCSDLEIAYIDVNDVLTELNKNKKNLGQNNCGTIFINNYVVKCIKKSTEINNNEKTNKLLINNAEKINVKLSIFFPKYYKWNNGKFANYIKITNPCNLSIIMYIV